MEHSYSTQPEERCQSQTQDDLTRLSVVGCPAIPSRLLSNITAIVYNIGLPFSLCATRFPLARPAPGNSDTPLLLLPSARFRGFCADTFLLVAGFDVLGLTLLFVSVAGFIALRHWSFLFSVGTPWAQFARPLRFFSHNRRRL